MIIKNNEEYFRNLVCSPVDEHNQPEINEIILELEKNLDISARNGYPGIGLAAPQIGINKNIAIVRIKHISLNLVNTQIEKCFDKIILKDEGCLSFPGKVENTERYQQIVIKNLDRRYILSDLAAVCVQHEIDHWNNKVFWDHKKPQPLIKSPKIGPNEKCFCGSGIKYKKCCYLKS